MHQYDDLEIFSKTIDKIRRQLVDGNLEKITEALNDNIERLPFYVGDGGCDMFKFCKFVVLRIGEQHEYERESLKLSISDNGAKFGYDRYGENDETFVLEFNPNSEDFTICESFSIRLKSGICECPG